MAPARRRCQGFRSRRGSGRGSGSGRFRRTLRFGTNERTAPAIGDRRRPRRIGSPWSRHRIGSRTRLPGTRPMRDWRSSSGQSPSREAAVSRRSSRTSQRQLAIDQRRAPRGGPSPERLGRVISSSQPANRALVRGRLVGPRSRSAIFHKPSAERPRHRKARSCGDPPRSRASTGCGHPKRGRVRGRFRRTEPAAPPRPESHSPFRARRHPSRGGPSKRESFPSSSEAPRTASARHEAASVAP